MAFMTHLQETGKPLDNYLTSTQSTCFLTGAFFPSSTFVPCTFWYRDCRWACLGGGDLGKRVSTDGSRFSVMI
jgi:hypothetical protein